VAAAGEHGKHVWADGGVRHPRDVALALAAREVPRAHKDVAAVAGWVWRRTGQPVVERVRRRI